VTYYVPGGNLTYTIRVTNNGPQTVIGATLADNIPAQIAFWSWTCVPDFSSPAPRPNRHNREFLGYDQSGGRARRHFYRPGTCQRCGNRQPGEHGFCHGARRHPGSVPSNNIATDTDAAPTADLSATMTDAVAIYTPEALSLTTL